MVPLAARELHADGAVLEDCVIEHPDGLDGVGGEGAEQETVGREVVGWREESGYVYDRFARVWVWSH